MRMPVTDFLMQMFGSSRLEWIAAALGFIAVVLTIRRSVWNYLFGIPCVIIYAHLFLEWQLYSQAILYVYYIGMLYAGFYWWMRGRSAEGLVVIERTATGEFVLLCLATVAGVAALGHFMATQTDARLPYLDAATTVIAAFGQYLQSRRRVETYAVWFVVNILSIGLFALSGNPPTALLYGIYLILSMIGLSVWVRAWRRNETIVA